MEYIAQMNVMPSIDGRFEKFTYALLLGFWGMLLWHLLAFQAFLRSVIGRSAMDDILLEWVYGLVMEHFGLASLRLMAFKSMSIWIGVKLLRSLDKQKGIEDWYEEHVFNVFELVEKMIFTSNRGQEQDEVEELEEGEDGGEEMMGEDADSGNAADITV